MSLFGFVTRKAPGIAKVVAASVTAAVVVAALTGFARAETKTLKLYNTHTHERTSITFKKNGRYVRSGLRDLNRFLRDWRRNESIKMDPRLFDLIWEVYRKTGSSQPIHVVSGYRSPATNNMLRKRSRGVAKFSQHTLGKAMDFFIPGTASSKIRVIGMREQTGGVGFYPRSRSKFIHLDTGRVRHWPRMTRQQLVKVFPRGNTLHLPRRGKPLPGYQTALARAKSGKSLASRSTRVASLTNPTTTYVDDDNGGVLRPKGTGSNFLTALFGGGLDEEEDNSADVEPTQTAPVRTREGPVPPSTVGTRPTQVAALTPAAQTDATKTAATPTDLVPKVEAKKKTVPGLKPRPKPVIQLAAAEPIETQTPVAVPRTKPIASRFAALDRDVTTPDQTTTAALPSSKPREVPENPSAAAVLAYAPAVPEAKPGSVFDATRNFAKSERRVAALPSPSLQPRARPTSSNGAAGTGGTTIAPRRPSDPFARFTGFSSGKEKRLLVASKTAQTMAFANLYHPNQNNIGELLSFPRRTVTNDFADRSDFGLTSELFSGEAIAMPQVTRIF